ncbi:MAG TPA: hypothetical protein PLU30_12650 [Verrucomicrobiae bacterium]|nr:hypothetical protein [Verrucomicrobiae bacterium]
MDAARHVIYRHADPASLPTLAVQSNGLRHQRLNAGATLDISALTQNKGKAVLAFAERLHPFTFEPPWEYLNAIQPPSSFLLQFSSDEIFTHTVCIYQRLPDGEYAHASAAALHFSYHQGVTDNATEGIQIDVTVAENLYPRMPWPVLKEGLAKHGIDPSHECPGASNPTGDLRTFRQIAIQKQSRLVADACPIEELANKQAGRRPIRLKKLLDLHLCLDDPAQAILPLPSIPQPQGCGTGR